MNRKLLSVVLSMTILAAAAAMSTNSTNMSQWGITPAANGTTLSLEAPPPTSLFLNGSVTNLTADDQDRDLTIDPTDDLPSNGTQIMGTLQATDIDINTFPPVGVSVLIQNGSITVTNHTVWIGQQ